MILVLVLLNCLTCGDGFCGLSTFVVKKMPVLKKIQDSQKRFLISSFTSWLCISLIKIQCLFVFVFVLLLSLFFTVISFLPSLRYLKIIFIYIYIFFIHCTWIKQ